MYHDYPGAPTPMERIRINIRKIGTAISMALTCAVIASILSAMLLM